MVLLAVIVFGLLWPAIFARTQHEVVYGDPVRFTDYRADFTVDRDGRLSAVETITAAFPRNRHGIARAFDVANDLAPHTRQIPTAIRAEIDGAPTDVATYWQDVTTYVARIGNPDRSVLPGPHVITIRYDVAGVLDPGGTGAGMGFESTAGTSRDAESAFVWNVVPSWNTRIDRAQVSLTLPGPVVGAGCSVGSSDRPRPCDGLTVTGNTVRTAATDLIPHTPIRVRVGTDVPTPTRATVPWAPRFDDVLGRNLGGLVWPAVVTLVGALGAWFWLRLVRGPAVPAPVQLAPPDGLGPAQWDYLRTLEVGPHALTATLLHLAENDLVALTEVNRKCWTVEGVGDSTAWQRVDGVSRRVAEMLQLTRPGKMLNANGSVTAGRQLARARDDLDGAVAKWAERERLVVPHRHGDVKALRFCGVVAAVVAVVLFTRWFDVPTVWGVPFALMFVLSIPAWRISSGPQWTEVGRALASKALGFQRFLSTDSAEARFDFAGRSGLYTSYLPYAVAAGVADRWAAKFEKITGTPPPEPRWSRLDSSSSVTMIGLVGFDSAVSSSLDSYAPSLLSDSGGGYTGSGSFGSDGGGGGFSGGDGGGGGGGGGSW